MIACNEIKTYPKVVSEDFSMLPLLMLFWQPEANFGDGLLTGGGGIFFFFFSKCLTLTCALCRGKMRRTKAQDSSGVRKLKKCG